MSYAASLGGFGLGASASTPVPTVKQNPIKGSDQLEDLIRSFQNHPRVKTLLDADPSFDRSAFISVMRKALSLVGSGVAGSLPVPLTQKQAASTVQGVLAKLKADLRQVKAFEVSAHRNDPTGRKVHQNLIQADLNLMSKLYDFVEEAQPEEKGTSGLGFIGIVGLIIPAIVIIGLWSAFDESEEGARKAAHQYCRNKEGGCTPKEYEEYFKAAGGESSVDKLMRYGKDVVDDKVPDPTDITKGIGTGVKWVIILGGVGVLGALAYVSWPYMTGARSFGERFGGGS